MCEDEFRSYLKRTKKNIEELVLIVDEADQVLFAEQSQKMNEKELTL